MKKFLVSSAIILLCLSTASAKVYETLVLSDGFKLQGYIMERIPGKSMTMDVESIIGRIERSYIESHQDVEKNNVSLLKIVLSEEGIEALGGEADLKPIENNYAFNSVLGPVEVLRKGRQEYDYKFAPKGGCGVYVVDEGIIEAIETTPRDKDASRGIVDVVETRDGTTYSGQIIKNTLGQELLMNDDEGIPMDPISTDDIVSMRVIGLDEEEDILRQAEYLDVIVSDDFGEPLEGVIVAKVYEEDSNNDHVVIYTLSGDEETVQTNSITKFGREKNKDFKAGKKYTVNSGEVWVCSNKAKRYDGRFERNKGSYGIVNAVAKKEAIDIKYSDLDDGEIIVENKNENRYSNPSLIKMNVNKFAVPGASKNIYTFNDSELMNSRSNVVEMGRPNSKNVVRTVFKVKEPAVNTSDLYILFYKSENEDLVYIIRIKA